MKFRGTYDITSAPEVSGMKFPNTSLYSIDPTTSSRGFNTKYANIVASESKTVDCPNLRLTCGDSGWTVLGVSVLPIRDLDGRSGRNRKPMNIAWDRFRSLLFNGALLKSSDLNPWDSRQTGSQIGCSASKAKTFDPRTFADMKIARAFAASLIAAVFGTSTWSAASGT